MSVVGGDADLDEVEWWVGGPLAIYRDEDGMFEEASVYVL
jgi:hypothetical protein